MTLGLGLRNASWRMQQTVGTFLLAIPVMQEQGLLKIPLSFKCGHRGSNICMNILLMS